MCVSVKKRGCLFQSINCLLLQVLFDFSFSVPLIGRSLHSTGSRVWAGVGDLLFVVVCMTKSSTPVDSFHCPPQRRPPTPVKEAAVTIVTRRSLHGRRLVFLLFGAGKQTETRVLVCVVDGAFVCCLPFNRRGWLALLSLSLSSISSARHKQSRSCAWPAATDHHHGDPAAAFPSTCSHRRRLKKGRSCPHPPTHSSTASVLTSFSSDCLPASLTCLSPVCCTCQILFLFSTHIRSQSSSSDQHKRHFFVPYRLTFFSSVQTQLTNLAVLGPVQLFDHKCRLCVLFLFAFLLPVLKSKDTRWLLFPFCSFLSSAPRTRHQHRLFGTDYLPFHHHHDQMIACFVPIVATEPVLVLCSHYFFPSCSRMWSVIELVLDSSFTNLWPLLSLPPSLSLSLLRSSGWITFFFRIGCHYYSFLSPPRLPPNWSNYRKHWSEWKFPCLYKFLHSPKNKSNTLDNQQLIFFFLFFIYQIERTN